MLKKIFFWFLLIIILVVTGFGTWLYLNKERIENSIMTTVQSYLDVKAEIGSVELDPFSNFPYISLELNDVLTEGSGVSTGTPLIRLGQISLGVEFWDIIRGDLVIRHILLSEGQINIIDPKNGPPNYNILKETDGEQASYDSIPNLEIEDITLNKVLVSYDVPDEQIHIAAEARKMKADLVIADKMIQAGINFDGRVPDININGSSYFFEQEVDFNGLLNVDLEASRFHYKDLKLHLEGIPISADMELSWSGVPTIDLLTTITPADIDLVNKQLPKSVSEVVEKIQVKGNAGGTFAIKGQIDSRNDPAVEIKVPLKDLEIGYFDSLPENPLVKDGLLIFSSPRFFQDSTNRLDIRLQQIKWGEGSLNGEFIIPVLAKDHCSLKGKGRMSLENLIEISQTRGIKDPKGLVDFEITYIGPILKENQHIMDGSKISGSAVFDSLQLTIAGRDIFTDNLTGSVEFNNEILSFTDVRADFGETDLEVDGYAINFLNFVFYENQELHFESKIQSKNLVLENLLRSAKEDQDFVLALNPRVSMLLKPEIENFQFKTLVAQNIRGKIKIKDQKIKTRDMSMDLANGKVRYTLELDGTDTTKYSWMSDFSFDSLMLDSTFLCFNNFNQDFVKAENLRGRLSATGGLYIESNKALDFDLSMFQAEVDARVSDGKLVDFDPIRNIEKFLDRKSDLENIEFDELENNIVIRDRKVLIPKMEVRSSAKNAYISGFHQFDNHFEYHLQIPVFGKNRRDKDEQYGIVEEASGLSFALIKVEGTPEDYKVDYDTEELVKKVKRGFFMETQEAFDLFRKKKKEKSVEFAEDDYYEIDQ